MTVLAAIENTAAGWDKMAEADTAWAAAGWTEQGQRERFNRVFMALDLQPGESILDYGCGTGAFADWVDELDDSIVYVGYDWSPALIRRAKSERPWHRFQNWDPVAEFDAVAAIGTFNLADRWSKQHTWWKLRGLWERTRRVLAVSLYAGGDERCLSYTLDEASAFSRLAPAATVHAWRSNDILLVLERG